jgi:hypothetical protein
LPPIEETQVVSLRTEFASFIIPEVDVDGNPELKPGSMAMDGLQASGECGYFVLLCAMVVVPTAAATGAVITAVETLPDEQALTLNQVSKTVMSGLDQDVVLDNAMRGVAARQSVVLRKSRADVLLNVTVTQFKWDVSVGNNVAMKIKLYVWGQANGKKGDRNFSFTGKRAKAPEWTADSGALIRQEFSALMEQASERIWREVLDIET